MNIFSEISLWFVFPWLLASVAGAIWYYRKQTIFKENGKLRYFGLISLRTAALFLIGLLLFGILLEQKETKKEKPIFITLIDNSLSMLNYSDSLKVKDQITAYRNKLNADFSERFEIIEINVDAQVKQGRFDLKGRQTDLNRGFDYIFNRYYNRNIGGICLVSDGNYNAGPDPQYTAKKMNLTPVFSLAVGDTIIKRDQFIQSLVANEVAFLDNDFPLEVNIQGDKLQGRSGKLILYHGKNKIEEKTITHVDSKSYIQASFMVKATTPGFNNYSVTLTEISGESTLANNTASVFIEVIDTRSKVLLLTERPHPDISAIKEVLNRNDRLDVVSTLIEDWDKSLKNVELVIIHGMNGAALADINAKSIQNKIPVWYFFSANSQSTTAKSLVPDINWPNSNQSDEVQAYQSNGFQLFETSDAIESLLAFAPPIRTKFGSFSGNVGNTLLQQRIGPVNKKDPVLSFKTRNGTKSAIFFGEGIWRWKLLEYKKTGDHKGFNELIEKSVQYLLVRNTTEPLRIKLPRRFNVNDEIRIDAEFYNEALEQITTPYILFTLENEKGKKFDYSFAKRARDYRLVLGQLTSGKYTWKASTSHSGKKYTKSGEFVVDDISIEAQTTVSNFGMMQTLAGLSNGKVYRLKDHDQLIKELSQREDIVTITYEESEFNYLIELLWILLLLALILGSEWFIRRYSGSY